MGLVKTVSPLSPLSPLLRSATPGTAPAPQQGSQGWDRVQDGSLNAPGRPADELLGHHTDRNSSTRFLCFRLEKDKTKIASVFIRLCFCWSAAACVTRHPVLPLHSQG